MRDNHRKISQAAKWEEQGKESLEKNQGMLPNINVW